jgi:hypothetical protein
MAMCIKHPAPWLKRSRHLFFCLIWALAFHSFAEPRSSAAKLVPADSLAKRVAATRLKRKADHSDPFFRRGEIPRLKIEIAGPELGRLHQNHREYVRANVVENDKTEYQSIGIRAENLKQQLQVK